MKLRTGSLLAAVAAAACALLIFPAQASLGAKNGLNYSMNILIPSLYPFMVLSVFVVKSGLAEKIGRFLEKPTRALFRLPGSAATSALMGLIGGYPAGARSVAALYETGAVTQAQAERMLYFCVNSGPSFVITAVGVGFLKNPAAGAVLFAAQTASFLLMGILTGAVFGRREKAAAPGRPAGKITGAAQALIDSASDAAYSTLMMCCFVILFAVLMAFVRMFVTRPVPAAAASALLEVTGGCSDLSKLRTPLWVFSLALGWGGVCVHFQVLACAGKLRVNRIRFVLCRLLQGLFAAAACWGITALFPESAETFSGISGPVAGELADSVPAGAALVMLLAVLLMCMPKEKLDADEKQCYNKNNKQKNRKDSRGAGRNVWEKKETAVWKFR